MIETPSLHHRMGRVAVTLGPGAGLSSVHISCCAPGIADGPLQSKEFRTPVGDDAHQGQVSLTSLADKSSRPRTRCPHIQPRAFPDKMASNIPKTRDVILVAGFRPSTSTR